MVKYLFPENFFWGSASSGPQSEGRFKGDGKVDNIWDYWYKENPDLFFDKVGPEKTSYVYKKYKEDVQLMKKTGHNSFRTSIQWSRLIDQFGNVNEKAVEFYKCYFDEMRKNGIEPFVNLYHFDMPMYLQEQGGWENRKTVYKYVEYATKCFELFGDKVKFWFTHNEPIVPVEGGYLYKFHYPSIVNMKKAVQVAFHECLASAMAVREYRKFNNDEGHIGIILNLTPSYPKDENNEEDVKAAKIADGFFNRSFLDPAVKGEYPSDLIEIIKELKILPKYEKEDIEIIKNNTINFLGINYYQPRRIQAKINKNDIDENNPMPENYFDYYDKPDKKINPYRGWEIYEKGIYDLLINIKENYGNIPCYISENGMGVENEKRYLNHDGIIEDDYRIKFIKNHLKYVHKAIDEGVNCRGYHLWTFIDNWSWLNAYKNRYGLVSLDLDKHGERTIKKSGYFFYEMSKNNGFD